jgi:hypothetical protein
MEEKTLFKNQGKKKIKYQREYRLIHQEEHREYNRKYYFKNKEQVIKEKYKER